MLVQAFGGHREFLVAEPEKTLLDHWHLAPGEWTETRLAEMRYQEHGLVDGDRLLECAARFRSPRLERAAGRWLKLAGEEERGTVTL